jgi:hypothetical protein
VDWIHYRWTAPTDQECKTCTRGVLIVLGVLLALHYLPGLIDLMGDDPTLTEYLENPTSFFLIATMDLGIFMSASIASGIGLWNEREGSINALYAIVSWFALVGVAVAAMTIVMRINDDPNASTGHMVGFLFFATVFLTFAICLYWMAFARPQE